MSTFGYCMLIVDIRKPQDKYFQEKSKYYYYSAISSIYRREKMERA